MRDRSHDWLAQAQRDLEHAGKDARDGYYEHACFDAQQASEKAIKSVYLHHHAEGWGHSAARLLEEAREIVEAPAKALIDDAKVLDQYYILTRYPNGFESGAPKDYFTEEQARDAVRRAENIVRWCQDLQGA
ncbi:MAG: HEPN domain-containing protein [Kiritimatiellae bacterium]|nr:HEPN domain-containing protein [Kiritimatiellia bacterium]